MELVQVAKDLGLNAPRADDTYAAQEKVGQCFSSASYYVNWEKAVRKSCREPNMLMNPKTTARWCIPEPTAEASKYKLISSRDVEFDWDWLNPAMERMEIRPKVHECVYGRGGGPDATAPDVLPRRIPLFGESARDHLKGKKIAVVHDKTAFGKGLADAALDKMHKLGIREVLYEGVNTGEKDYSAIVSKIKESGADFLVWGGLPPEGGLIIRQMRDQGMKTVMISGDGTADNKSARIGGTAKFYFWAQEPPPLRFFRTVGLTGAMYSRRVSDKGVGGEMFAYDFVGAGHYLGIRVVDRCPEDLVKAIRLRQSLLKEVMGPYPN